MTQDTCNVSPTFPPKTPSLTPTSSEQVEKKQIYQPTFQPQKVAAGCRREKTELMLCGDEVRAVLMRGCNEPQRLKLRYPPIKTKRWPWSSLRGSCVRGSALTKRWTLIASLWLIARTLIMLDKEEHKSRGEVRPTAGPRHLAGKLSRAGSEQLRSHYVFDLTKSQQHLWYCRVEQLSTHCLSSVWPDESNLRPIPDLAATLWWCCFGVLPQWKYQRCGWKEAPRTRPTPWGEIPAGSHTNYIIATGSWEIMIWEPHL